MAPNYKPIKSSPSRRERERHIVFLAGQWHRGQQQPQSPRVSEKQCCFPTKRGQCVATCRVTAGTQSTKQNKAWNSNTMHISLSFLCTLQKKKKNYDHFFWQATRVRVCCFRRMVFNGLESVAVRESVTNQDDKCNVTYHTGCRCCQKDLVVENVKKPHKPVCTREVL